ncbi:hypothetical protein Tco_0478979 [Tanacetum coccineum]
MFPWLLEPKWERERCEGETTCFAKALGEGNDHVDEVKNGTSSLHTVTNILGANYGKHNNVGDATVKLLNEAPIDLGNTPRDKQDEPGSSATNNVTIDLKGHVVGIPTVDDTRTVSCINVIPNELLFQVQCREVQVMGVLKWLRMKSRGSEGFHQIIDFLTTIHIKYAFTKNPTIYVSLIHQFWETASASTSENGEKQITATIDRRIKTITEASIRRHLNLEDSDGIPTLPNAKSFEQLAFIGPKTAAWEQFSSNIATAIICLATNRNFNFSKMIFDGMMKKLDSNTKFLMYPRFIQIFLNMHKRHLLPHKRTYVALTLTQKLFSNMRRVSKGYTVVDILLFPTMLTAPKSSPSRITSSPSLSPQTHLSTSQQPPTFMQTIHDAEEPATMPHDSSQPRKQQDVILIHGGYDYHKGAAAADNLNMQQEGLANDKRYNCVSALLLPRRRETPYVRRGEDIDKPMFSKLCLCKETASASTSENEEMEITTTIDGRIKTVTEASIRRHLKLEDSDGIPTLPNAKFFEQLALMGPKTAAWEQFSSNIATAIICLATNKTFNFSKMIFDGMMKKLDSNTKFLIDDGSLTLNELTVLCTTLSKKVEDFQNELQLTKLTYGAAYAKLILRVKKLEHKVKVSKSRRRTRVIISDNEEDLEDSYKQGRIIAEIDQNPSISLVQDEGTSWIQEDAEIQTRTSADTKILLDQKEPTELVEDPGNGEKGEKEISTANISVSTAGVSTTEAVLSTVIPEVSTTAENLVYIRRSVEKRKDKGKAIMKEDESVQKKTKKQLEKERLSHEVAIRLQEQVNEEERQRIARDAKIAKQLQEEIDIARQEQEKYDLAQALELQKELDKRKEGSVEEQSARKEKEVSEEELKKLLVIVQVEEVYIEALQDLAKKKFSSTEPTIDKEKVLWVELKMLFKPDNDDTLWKHQRYMHNPLK